MNYSVNLVQRGISAVTHPVNGKSGKLYGQAVQSPEHGGVLYVMGMKDYIDNAHDLVGNTTAGQQWVPEFVPSAVIAQSKCNRCSKPAVARWDRYDFCEEHAPNNAAYLDGTGYVGQAKTLLPPATAATPPRTDTSLTPPVREGGLTQPVQELKELAPEHMRAPVLGTDKEDSPPERTESGVVQLDPVKPTPQPTPQPTPPPAPPVQHPILPQPAVAQPGPKPAAATSVVEAITIAVVDRITAALPGAIDKVLDHKLHALATPESDPAPAPRPRPSRKKTPPAPKSRPASEFSQLQHRAKELGINSFGKKAEALRAEIAAKEKPATEPVDAIKDDEIPF